MTARADVASEDSAPMWTWNYTLFIVGLMISNAGTWVQRIAQSWLVLEITSGDGSALGITTALQFSPVLILGAWGGVVVDRLPKRQLVLITQAGMGLLALALAVLTLSGMVQVWHIYLLATLLGVFNVFDNPARNAMLNEIVDRSNLARAIGVNSACFNVARMAGPSLGGILVATAGAGTAFLVNGLSYGVVIVCLCLMRTTEMSLAPLVERQRGQLMEGVRYVLSRHDLVISMIVIAFVNSFAMNYQVTVALMSREALGLTATAYGVLFGAIGAGSICGALLAARRRHPCLRTA